MPDSVSAEWKSAYEAADSVSADLRAELSAVRLSLTTERALAGRWKRAYDDKRSSLFHFDVPHFALIEFGVYAGFGYWLGKNTGG